MFSLTGMSLRYRGSETAGICGRWNYRVASSSQNGSPFEQNEF